MPSPRLVVHKISVVSTFVHELLVQLIESRHDESVFRVIIRTGPELDIWKLEPALLEALGRRWPELRSAIRQPKDSRLILEARLSGPDARAGAILRLAADIIDVSARQSAH